MKQKTVIKILIIISIIILLYGISLGLNLSYQYEKLLTQNLMVDGADIAPIVNITTLVASKMYGAMIIIGSIIITIFIWFIYMIILFILKIINKIIKRKK